MMWAFETSKYAASDAPFPISSYLLILPNSSTSCGPSIKIYDFMKAILIQTIRVHLYSIGDAFGARAMVILKLLSTDM